MARDDGFKSGLALIVVGGGFVLDGVKRILKHRRVQDTATSKVAYAPQGNVEIEAYAWPINKPYNACNGKLCAYYSCQLQQYVKRGKHSSWETVWSYKPMYGFLIIDRTGTIEVITKDAEVTARRNIIGWGKVPVESEIYLTANKNYEIKHTGLFGRSYRLLENYIPMGSPCYVQGNLHTSKMKDLVNTKAKQFQEYLDKKRIGQVHKNMQFDKNNDGMVSAAEVRHFLMGVAEKIWKSDSKPQQDENKLKIFGEISTTKDSRLIVSDMHEHHFLGHLNQWNLLKITGGAAAVAGGVYILVNEFAS